jgi:hypothetical protein
MIYSGQEVKKLVLCVRDAFDTLFDTLILDVLMMMRCYDNNQITKEQF